MVDTELLDAHVHTRITAFLDANVLHPMVVCDLLIRLALEGLYRPVWSARVLEEVLTSVLRRRPEIPPERLKRRLDLMNDALPGAETRDYEHLMAVTARFGTDDHVVAAAMHARVDVIVTDNIRDFPSEDLDRLGLRAQTVDDFLLDLWAMDQLVIRRVLTEQAAETRNPPLSVRNILDRLLRAAPRFVAAARPAPDETSGGSANIGE